MLSIVPCALWITGAYPSRFLAVGFGAFFVHFAAVGPMGWGTPSFSSRFPGAFFRIRKTNCSCCSPLPTGIPPISRVLQKVLPLFPPLEDYE